MKTIASYYYSDGIKW